jgi:hypothetical protein
MINIYYPFAKREMYYAYIVKNNNKFNIQENQDKLLDG